MKRFKYAFQGCWTILKKDRNFLYHLLGALLVIFLAWLLALNVMEWLFIFIAIFLVLITEALNTAIEYAVDLTTDSYHIKAKHAKDIAAFSVLLAAIFAFITASFILLPKLISLL